MSGARGGSKIVERVCRAWFGYTGTGKKGRDTKPPSRSVTEKTEGEVKYKREQSVFPTAFKKEVCDMCVRERA